MCGNGARCFGNFAAALLHHDKTAPFLLKPWPASSPQPLKKTTTSP
ncbi:hypothetical protein [Akkermansia muciniphila]|nr:hypothetical protein [Akkermansia muciniphila]